MSSALRAESMPAAQPSPELIFDTLNAFQRTAALKAAIELEVFTAIADGAHTATAIAQRCQASERGIRILCDYLTTITFLTKQHGEYALTPESAMFLNKQSPAYMGCATGFLVNGVHLASFWRLTEAVRRGGTAMENEGSVKPENPDWVDFARSMAPLFRMAAEMLAKMVKVRAQGPTKVLDIAAGHGLYGIAFARHTPTVEVTAVDWANVLEVAKENAQAAGVADRYRTIAGDAFAVEFGSGYDVALLTNILHHFDAPTNEKLLRKVHASLAPGGRAVILEFVPNPDRVTPPRAAQFSLVMLANTPSGDAYTYAEFERMCKSAGFASTELHDLPPIEQVVIANK